MANVTIICAKYLGVKISPDGRSTTIINVNNPHESEVVPNLPDGIINNATALLCVRHPLLN